MASSLGSVTVPRLTRVVVEDYRDRRLRAGLSTYTVSAEVRILGVAYRWWGSEAHGAGCEPGGVKEARDQGIKGSS
jgi:hypothetical protein